MLDNLQDLKAIVYTVKEILKADKETKLSEILEEGNLSACQSGYDNWDGGIYLYTIYIAIDVSLFVQNRDNIQNIEAALLERFSLATRHIDNERITNILITPVASSTIDWSLISGLMTKPVLLVEIDFLRNTLESVSTGGQRINDINEDYKKRYEAVDTILYKLNITNPNPFKDLWDWYAKWHAEFDKYYERRAFIQEMYGSLVQVLRESNKQEIVTVTVDLTNWERIERSINQIKIRQTEAQSEEQFQVVGLLCRETIVTIAQAVFISEKHPSLT